jgi:hypothetical protein
MPVGVRRDPRARLRHVLGTVAKVLLLALAGTYLAYLVGINLFMSTALFGMAINADPKTLDIHFDRGWSLRPGRVHAKNLSIRSRDGSVEWMLRIDEVQFDLSFAALAKHRFAASHVRGYGGSFRLRSRLDPWQVNPARVARLPPIAGFPAVPVRPYSQCSASEWSDADYHLWTVQLEDVHAEAVAELWIDGYRLEGSTSTSGRFFLKPVRAIEVGPLHTEIRRGDLTAGGERWIEGLDASADFTLPRFDPRLQKGNDLLRTLSLGVETHGVVPDLGKLPIATPSDVRLRGALQLRRLGLRFEGGRALPGSHVDGVGPAVVLEQGEHRVTSSVALTGDVQDGAESLALHVVAGAARLERAGQTIVVAPRVDMMATARAPEVGRDVEGLHLTVESPELETPDVRAFAPYIPASAKVTLASGRARGGAWGEAWPDESRARGRANMQAEDLDVRVADVHLRGGAGAEASLSSLDWSTGRIEGPQAAVTIDSRVEVGAKKGAGRGNEFAADVRAVAVTRGYRPEDGTVDVSGSGAKVRNIVVDGQPAASSYGDAWLEQGTLRLDRPEFEGLAAVDVTDATPLLVGVREGVPGPFRGLLDIPRLTASARLSVDARRAELSEVEAHGGRLTVNGLFAAGRGDRLGAFVVQGAIVSVGVGVDPRGAHVRFFGLSGWLEQEEENVSRRFGEPVR